MSTSRWWAMLMLIPAAACGADESEPGPTVAVGGEELATDAFDSTCGLLGDLPAVGAADVVRSVLVELTEISGDEQTAANTLRIAAADRCHEWTETVDAVLAGD